MSAERTKLYVLLLKVNLEYAIGYRLMDSWYPWLILEGLKS